MFVCIAIMPAMKNWTKKMPDGGTIEDKDVKLRNYRDLFIHTLLHNQEMDQ
jgi:hypothetical protein